MTGAQARPHPPASAGPLAARAPAPTLRYSSGTSAGAPLSRHVLADIGFGAEHGRDRSDARRIVIGTPPLGGCGREQWRLSHAATRAGWEGDIGFVVGGDFLFAHLLLPEPDGENLEWLAYDAYRRLLGFVRRSSTPRLLRIWNYLARINEHERGIERYQAFCVGRARALAEIGIGAGCFPAATAVGSPSPGLSVHLLAGRRPGTPIENPRQLAAYRYPLPYGPRPPAFARAMRYGGSDGSIELAVSGTASIVGHVTMHPHRFRPQLRETLRNLDRLVEHTRLPVGGADTLPPRLKVYLRHPAHGPEALSMLHEWAGPTAQIMLLQGDICRRDLALEVEAHFTVRGQPERTAFR